MPRNKLSIQGSRSVFFSPETQVSLEKKTVNFQNLGFRTRLFLQDNPRALRALKALILKLRINDKISLKSHHIEKAFKIIQLERKLPHGVLNNLSALPVNFETIIQGVSDKLALELLVLSKQNKQLHHGLPHALEVEKRTMCVLREEKIWQTDTVPDRFLRAVTACLVRLNDYVQKDKNNDNEAKTAASVANALVRALCLEKNNVEQIIQWMSYQIIVGGTLPLMSVSGAMDLIDFQLELETIVPEPVNQLNRRLIVEMKQVAKIVGENDKTPGAVLVNVLNQTRDKTLATLDLIKKHTDGSEILQVFFDAKLKAYYSDNRLRRHCTADDLTMFGSEKRFFAAVNQQAFLTSIIPHLSMPPEYFQADDINQNKLYRFIEVCRTAYPKSFASGVFARVFNLAFEKYSIDSVIKEMFFDSYAMNRERVFLEGQMKLLRRRESKAPRMGLSFASAKIPGVDSVNLQALQIFYAAHPSRQTALVKALMMAVVLQEGQILAYHLQHINIDEVKKEAVFGCRCF